MYGLQQLSFLHLVGKVLGNAKQSKSKEVAYITLKIKELEKFNVDVEDTHGLINYLLSLSDVKVVCMFREVSKNETKSVVAPFKKLTSGQLLFLSEEEGITSLVRPSLKNRCQKL